MAAFKRICNNSRLYFKSLHCNHTLNMLHSSSFCTNNDDDKNKNENDKKKEELKSFFSESWQKAMNEINRQQQQQQQQQELQEQPEPSQPDNHNVMYQEWLDKYNLMKSENKFIIESLNYLDFKIQWEYFTIIYFRDPLYRYAMNSWLTGFSERFVFYEEFMAGVVDGFKFIVQCLEQNEFEQIKDCFISQVFHHIKPLKISLLKEDYKLNKVNAYVYNVRVDREKIDFNQMVQQPQTQQPQQQVELFFDVKYYCQFMNDNNEYEYKIIDVLWHSKYEAITGERLKYQITKPWCINHLTVSAIRQ